MLTDGCATSAVTSSVPNHAIYQANLALTSRSTSVLRPGSTWV
jgi:hypothetical protein